MIEDIRVWIDAEDAEPARQLRAILKEHGCRGRRLGVEWEAYGLTARNGQRLAAALEGLCALEDASELVSRRRVVKSPAELANDALDEANRLVQPGAFEGDILGAMHAAVFRGDGDYPGNEFIIGSGRDALLCRYFSGRKHLQENDQITLEFAETYRHYHACLMRTILVGEPHPDHVAMHAIGIEAMEACLEALKPGRPMGEVFDAYARVMDAGGMGEHRMNACGYSLGACFAPNWMDWPMFHHSNPVLAEPNMVFFLHMIMMDSGNNRAMCPAQTVVVTGDGCEVLSRHPLDLVVNK